MRNTNLGGGHGPDLVVVGSHEQIGHTGAHHAHNPLVEVLGLGVGDAGVHGGVNQAIDTLDLVLLGQHGYVVLEGIWNPLALATDVGDALVAVPVVILGESLVDAVVEVFVVGEDDVTADVVELVISICLKSRAGRGRTKPSGVTSVEARPPGTSLLSIIIHEGPSI